MVGDVAGYREAIKLCIKGEVGGKGWFAPCIPTDRAGRGVRVEAQPRADAICRQAMPEVHPSPVAPQSLVVVLLSAGWAF